jgi:hypothetical protein
VNNPDFGNDVQIEVGRYRGFRWWSAAAEGVLESPWYSKHIWDPDSNQATCWAFRRGSIFSAYRVRESDHEGRGSPYRGCKCGFYGLHEVPVEGDQKFAMPWERDPTIFDLGTLVFGVAEAWGRILLGRHGWRAQYARAVALFLNPLVPLENTDADELSQHYPALAIFPSLPTMVAEFGPDEVEH